MKPPQLLRFGPFELDVRARELRKRGVRLLIGGDYGFAWNPHGDYARELTFFVRDAGFTPAASKSST